MRPALIELYRNYPPKTTDKPVEVPLAALPMFKVKKKKVAPLKKTSPKRKKRAQLWEQQKGTCMYCRVYFMSPDDWTLDHIKPRIARGVDDIKNLVWACAPCNTLKGGLKSSAEAIKIAKLYLEFAEILHKNGHTK